MALIIFWAVIASVVGLACWLGLRVTTPTGMRGRGGDGWPVDLQHAMDLLGNPVWAMHTWQQVGLGSPDAGFPQHPGNHSDLGRCPVVDVDRDRASPH